jgi:Ca2+-binding EF-hand superfamily protein
MKTFFYCFAVLVFTLTTTSMAFADGDHHDENHICFSQIDKNQDGEATPEEISKYYPKQKELFTKMDQDKNGTVSHEEYEEYWYNKE